MRAPLRFRSSFARIFWLTAALLNLAACGPILETNLQKAIKAHDAAAVERELAAGASLGRSWLELTPPSRLALLRAAEAPPDSIAILRRLVAAEPDAKAFLHQSFSVNCRKSPCYSPAPIEYVARQRNVEAVQVLIDAGLDLRSQGVANAVVYAIAEDDEPMARYLLEAGANVNGWAAAHGNRFVYSISILDAARSKENAGLVEYLRARGAR